MRVDIATEPRRVDIVAEGFDVGILLAEFVPQDMIAVPLTGDARMLIVGSPTYLPSTVNPRRELESHGQKRVVNMPTRLVLNEMRAIHQAACSGIVLVFMAEWFVHAELANGRLVSVLEEWCPPFGGLQLYYPGRRHVPAGLKALIELIHEQRDQRA